MSGRAPSTKSKAQLDAEFSDLYRAHLRDVYSYAYYRVGNHHDAEDLTEQTFLQAYRHFERAQRESNGRPLRPWLIRIAHNLAANLYRDRSRKPASPIDETTTLTAPHTTEQLVEGRDELSRVLDGVRQLPDDRREALIMRFALGMDNREIARALGPLRRRHQGADPPRDQAAGGDRRRSSSGVRPMTEALPNFEGLLREALAPVEPPEDLVERLEGTLHEHHRAGRGRARGVGALGDARPAQLGAPGGRDRRRAAPPARRSCCCGPAGAASRRDRFRGAPPSFDRAAAERAIRDLSRETRRLLGER